MIRDFKKLLIDLEIGGELDAFEAAKKISHLWLSKSEAKMLSRVVIESGSDHNKEAAIYAISCIEEHNSITLKVLVDVLKNSDYSESVRGRAAEGIGLINPSKRFKLRKEVEELLLQALKDPSPTVRFWSCYAVSMLELKSAIPLLEELQNKDESICPGWWYVSEEAEDAIAKIRGLDWEDRIPVDQRN